MAYELNEGRGSFFKNDKKQNEKQPDYTGSIKVGGVEYWLSVWNAESKTGRKYCSVAVTPKSGGSSYNSPSQQFDKPEEDFGDEIPF